ncbi:MAG: hypothetical protein AAGG01_22190 [Planctomycetota bacterium]
MSNRSFEAIELWSRQVTILVGGAGIVAFWPVFRAIDPEGRDPLLGRLTVAAGIAALTSLRTPIQ